MRFITDNKPRQDQGEEVPLMVIGAGLPRAATSSLQAALEKIGFAPCLHMAEIIPHADRMRLLLAAVREKDTQVRQKMLRQLIHGHYAICDLPVVFFTPDLMDMYPDVKIVLNGRPDPEVWARSAADSFSFIFSPWFKWTGLLWTTDRIWHKLNQESTKYCQELFGDDDIFTARCYNGYYDMVRAEAKKRGKEVLEFKAEDGYEPLCKFLGKDVPEEPFPRLNEKKTFQIVQGILIVRGLLAWSALGVGCWGTWKVADHFLR
ncbi:hypothetical protein BHE90_000451 [Fusarium euwallaceae]|uniref:Uncharacterized protein n=2 Tax=Fusarium solani species complex TaxID=232080 RepID=A0A3M2SLS8_9HYPO|nr:hypothetical protein CDV36_001845 [Fusarium kuroshium]RTE84959.1 hypothetical protein BHE90_000451 [Fusarium euwallaceae]